MKRIGKNEKAEFFGQIIDVFEDFLEARGIMLNNPERDYAIEDGADPEEVAIIYGSDYGDLQTELEDMMISWDLMTT